MTRLRRGHVAISVIALAMLPAGLQASFAPRSFFDDFPLGRGWISAGGEAYNEHLVRDVGGLFLALIVATAWTVWTRGPAAGVALAWLVQGVLHLAHHGRNLHDLGTADTIGLVVTLVAVPALAAVALLDSRVTRRSEQMTRAAGAHQGTTSP
jgi:hypothetical protein